MPQILGMIAAALPQQSVPTMRIDQLKPNAVVRGLILPDPVQIIMTIPMGKSVKLIGKGLNTGQVHEPILILSGDF